MKLINFDKSRYERKFVISEIEEEEIEHIIRVHPAMFSEIFYQRQVNNIYFDCAGLRSFHEHLSGIAERLKIRIRWYGRMFGFIEPVLEIKIKNNELGNKKIFPLKPFVLDRNFSLESIQEIFSKSGLPKWLSEELKLSFPVLLNCYKRKYFLSADKKFRLCLDTDMRFWKIKNRDNLFFEKIEMQGSILELKYPIKEFEGAKNITQYFPFRLAANSKFMKGVEGLEF